MSETLPAWSLSMYDGFDADNYKNNVNELGSLFTKMDAILEKDEPWEEDPVTVLEEIIPLLNRAHDLYESLESYTYCSYSVRTDDDRALNELNALEEKSVPFTSLLVRLRNRLASSASGPEGWKKSAVLKDYLYFLNESLEDQKYQMSPELEDLAADLSRSGASAWGRLQETISSSLKCDWAEGEEKSVIQLRSMAADPDRNIRERAWKKELECWKSVEIPMAAAINGIKGSTNTLNGRRGYESTLERSVRQAGMSRKTLDTMIAAMKDALPDFRRYMKAKARRMGLEKLAWYDTVAPLESTASIWDWKKTKGFIIEHFRALSPSYASFAERCFNENWIDAPPRSSKVGGAYCISFPLSEESRILTNFSGSFNDVSTVAHEMGHAWHHEVLKKAPALHRHYPMTLAETASIFSETLVFQACYAQASPEDKLSLLDSTLSDSNQVITDILSRFLFEKELMERRSSGELSPSELNHMMLRAQEETYGDALDPVQRHPWMWAVKGHYYNQDLAFYNFPYAFGLLFALGLYSLYEKMGSDFEPLYRKVLTETGRATVEDCGAAAGLDLRSEEFWQDSLSVILRQIDLFCKEV